MLNNPIMALIILYKLYEKHPKTSIAIIVTCMILAFLTIIITLSTL